MAGQLQTHPFLKTWDELQRSHKRMQNYLDMNGNLLDAGAKEDINALLTNLENAMDRIPPEYRVTKHYYTRNK
jgi:hypothetical protein